MPVPCTGFAVSRRAIRCTLSIAHRMDMVALVDLVKLQLLRLSQLAGMAGLRQTRPLLHLAGVNANPTVADLIRLASGSHVGFCLGHLGRPGEILAGGHARLG